MFKSIALLVTLVAIVFAQDVSVSGDFNAESAVLSYQTVKVSNLLSGANLTNALYEVSFTVSGDPLVLISGLLDGSISVGTILAGASGTAQFGVIALASGRFTLTINVSYRKAGSDDYYHYSQDFVLAVDDDGWLLKKDGIKVVAVAVPEKTAKRSAIESRQAGNNDANIIPQNYAAADGVKTWNNFFIQAGNADLLNTTFSVIVDDTSVSVFYPDDIGNNAGSISHNTTFETSIAFAGNTGVYNVNSSIRYRRTLMGSWKIFYNIYPLVISGDSSSFRAANYQKSLPTSNNPIFGQSNVVLGVAVGGVALVAAVAVVAAVVIIKKKQETVAV